jgi:hypothetical protein
MSKTTRRKKARKYAVELRRYDSQTRLGDEQWRAREEHHPGCDFACTTDLHEANKIQFVTRAKEEVVGGIRNESFRQHARDGSRRLADPPQVSPRRWIKVVLVRALSPAGGSSR